MRGKAKWSVLLALMLVMSLFLAACSGGGESSGGNTDEGGDSGGTTEDNGDKGTEQGSGDGMAAEQILHLAATGDIPSLDIHHATDATSFEADYELRSGLMRLDENGKAVPDMAASEPKVSEDKKVYTFTIRDDAKWSDGKPVTAQNFVDSWKRDVNPEEAGDYAYIYGSAFIKNAEKIMAKDSDLYGQIDKLGVEAVDDHTLKVTLEKPTPYFLSLMTFPPFFPIRKDIVEKYGEDYATAPDKMLYNGAFTLSEWNHGEGWTLKKNPDYWNADVVKLDTVDVKVVKDTSAEVNLYATNKLDFVSLTSEFIDKYKDKEGFNKGSLTATMYYLKLNQKTNKALQNEDIRDAIYNAIDRKGLTDGLLKTGAVPAKYFVPKGYIKGPDGEDFRAETSAINDHTLEEAKASWEKGLKAIGKDKLTLELLSTDASQSKKESTYLKAQLEQNLPGLTIKMNRQPRGSFFEMRGNFKYDLALSDWIPDYRDPMTYLNMWITDGSSNGSGYSDPEYDKLVDQIHKSGADPAKRWKLMHKAEKVLLEASGIVPLYQAADAYVQQPYVKDLYPRTVSGLDWTKTHIEKH